MTFNERRVDAEVLTRKPMTESDWMRFSPMIGGGRSV